MKEVNAILLAKRASLVVVFVFGSVIFTAEATAQCVQWFTQGRKFVCAPSSTGGKACLTNTAGTNCALTRPCGAGAAQGTWDGIDLEDTLVTDVGRVEPRLAAALALLRSRKELLVGGYARLYFMPEVTSPESVDSPTAPEEDSLHSLLERLDEDVQNSPPVEPLVYEVTIERAGTSLSAVMNIRRVAKESSAGSLGLAVSLTKSPKGQWKVTWWEARLGDR